MELLGLALLMFLGRLTVDIIATVKGTTPPHVEKAKLKATQQPRNRSPYADGKPRLRDVAAVLWGDALEDAIGSHNRRRAEKAAQRQENESAATAQREPRRVRPGLGERAKRFGRLLLNGRQPATKEGVDAAAAVDDALTPPADLPPIPDGPRIACPDCGSTLEQFPGGWRHKDMPGCPNPPKPAPTPSPQPAATPKPTPPRVLPPDPDPPIEGDDMTDPQPTTSTATGDAHDVETALQQCGLLDDDLTRIDTSLDVIDEAVTNAAQAAERIEAFLASKNVDDAAVTGMATVRDALSPDRIKVLIDAVASAKAGVKAAEDELRRLQDLESQLNGADGSVLNGR